MRVCGQKPLLAICSCNNWIVWWYSPASGKILKPRHIKAFANHFLQLGSTGKRIFQHHPLTLSQAVRINIVVGRLTLSGLFQVFLNFQHHQCLETGSKQFGIIPAQHAGFFQRLQSSEGRWLADRLVQRQDPDAVDNVNNSSRFQIHFILVWSGFLCDEGSQKADRNFKCFIIPGQAVTGRDRLPHRL